MIRFMLKSLPRRAGRAALVMSAVLAPVPACAQYIGAAPPPPAAPPPGTVETPEAALARNVRLIALNPRNFQALVAAGHAALDTGDAQAAIGFYGRAEELSPTSWQPQAGKGAAMVAMGEPEEALSFFATAQQYGATQMLIAVDRGLAFDLLGEQAKAQSDYRAALAGAEADEARRRLALSLAISRDMKGAAAMIDPLLRRGDRQAIRINAFVLALAGDRDGARRAIDTAMPGAGLRFEPFFKVLPVLKASEKAAAVHLGIFPKDAAERYAYAQPIPTSPVVTIGGSRQTIVSSLPARTPKTSKGNQAASSSKSAASKPQRIREPFYSSMDSARFRSTYTSPTPRRGKSESTTPKAPAQASAEPSEPDPARPKPDRLGDIAELLSDNAPEQGASSPVPPPSTAEPQVKVAEAEPGFAFDPPATSKPKVEIKQTSVSKPKVELAKPTKAEIDARKKADKLAADKKAKAEADKKAKAEATKVGVAGTNWVQLAGGANQDRMATEYKRLAAKAGSVLKSRSGYVTSGKDYFRLLVGPFATSDEAQDFVTKLDKAGVDSFRWTRNPAQIRIEKLKS